MENINIDKLCEGSVVIYEGKNKKRILRHISLFEVKKSILTMCKAILFLSVSLIMIIYAWNLFIIKIFVGLLLFSSIIYIYGIIKNIFIINGVYRGKLELKCYSIDTFELNNIIDSDDGLTIWHHYLKFNDIKIKIRKTEFNRFVDKRPKTINIYFIEELLKNDLSETPNIVLEDADNMMLD